MITIKTKEDIENLREGGKRLANVLRETAKMIEPGVSTDEINNVAHRLMTKNGDVPSFLNYIPEGAKRPYPASICVSVNDEIVHGIPNEDPIILKEGDIVTIDGGLTHENLITDHAITVAVGEISKEARRLMQVTQEALMSGIKEAKAGNRVGDIGAAIEAHAKKAGLAIIEGLAGHGVGYDVHEDPYIPNSGRRGTGDILKTGMVIAIEPMFAYGNGKIKLASDGYTYITKDGELSAQYEHTVAIDGNTPDILTK
ncbi:MAG: methionyl aminopeptidase [Candidatus Paceibacteria bacterium]|jgi:methionyl aminopeptidase